MNKTQRRIQDFPQGGAPIPKLGFFYKFFAENCMKMKEFGPGSASLVPPLDPPMKLLAFYKPLSVKTDDFLDPIRILKEYKMLHLYCKRVRHFSSPGVHNDLVHMCT